MKDITKITVNTKEQAWAEANKIFPTDYEKDETASANAGYPIYRHYELNHYSRICDLGNRLEVITGEYGENVTNIWIEPAASDAAPESETAATLPTYGKLLAENIRTKYGMDFSKLTHFENYILHEGYRFKTEEALRAGYDRAWKCSRDIALTESEFIAEAGEYYESETLKTVYAALVGMMEQKKITASEIYRYAYYKWCLRNPEAIIAYQEGSNTWIINNCGTKVTESQAKVAVNREWGFEVSRIQIIGTPYYDATDWQYIRFDCAQMTWLWKNGNLYQVYA